MNWSKGKSGRGRGTSFKGALDYVLHDKKARTSERVGQVLMLNLADNGRETVWQEMATTASAAEDLKKRAGIGPGGQKNERPVYAFTLSWHPKDNPTPAHMTAFAQDALKELGLEDHQAVITEHKDRPHKHLHVIVNLVHPVTGRTANLRNDERKLDKLCHKYELQQRAIRSKKRALRMETRWAFNREVFTGKAAQIKQSFAKEATEIRNGQETARRRRKEEKSNLWTAYKQAKQDIYEAYQQALDDVWQRRPREPAFNIRPPIDKRKSLGDFGRDTVIPLRPTLTGRFKQALFTIRRGNDKRVVPSFQDAMEDRHPRVPIGMARKAPDGTKKFQSAELKRNRTEDLAKLAADFGSQKTEMDRRHDMEQAGEKRDWKDYAERRDQAWAELNGDVQQSHSPQTPSQNTEYSLVDTFGRAALTPDEERAVRLVEQWASASQGEDLGRTISRSE